MKRTGSVTLVVCLLFGSLARAEPPSGFDEWLETERAQAGVPGVSIAVVSDFEVQWAATSGLADVSRGAPVTTDTLFQAASVSKPAAALALMIALARHGLDVEDEVDAVLDRFPPFGAARPWRLANPYPGKVSVRMLLSHTGGTNAFHYSGYRYAYDAVPPHPIDPLPSLADELFGKPPANTPTVAVDRAPGEPGFTRLPATRRSRPC